MDHQTWKDGYTLLNALAEREYHQSLDEVVAETDTAARIGRLLGVMLKEKFKCPSYVFSRYSCPTSINKDVFI